MRLLMEGKFWLRRHSRLLSRTGSMDREVTEATRITWYSEYA